MVSIGAFGGTLDVIAPVESDTPNKMAVFTAFFGFSDRLEHCPKVINRRTDEGAQRVSEHADEYTRCYEIMPTAGSGKGRGRCCTEDSGVRRGNKLRQRQFEEPAATEQYDQVDAEQNHDEHDQ